MTYSAALTAKLSGATPSQLGRWRRKGLVVPEVSAERPPLYSFRDVVALRAFVFLRARTSSQQLFKAWGSLSELDLEEVVDHPSTFKFGTDGKTIFVELPDEGVVDLTKRPGHSLARYTFEDLFAEFNDFRDSPVVDLTRPSSYLTVDPRMLGGFPVVEGTRVPYDSIVQLVDGATFTVEDVPDVFPHVTVEQARDALAFSDSLPGVA